MKTVPPALPRLEQKLPDFSRVAGDSWPVASFPSPAPVLKEQVLSLQH